MLTMFGHISWETTENMATWEREFLLDETMGMVELIYGKKDNTEGA